MEEKSYLEMRKNLYGLFREFDDYLDRGAKNITSDDWIEMTNIAAHIADLAPNYLKTCFADLVIEKGKK